MREVFKGSQNHSEFFVLVDSTTGLPKTGIADTAVTASYARQRSARVAITVSALGATTTAFTSGGWIEEDATNQPGLYRLDVPDAAFVTGVDQVVVTVKATGAKTEHKEFRLVDVNNQDAVRFGLTALPNAAAGATGGLDCTITLGGTAAAGSATSITLTGGVATDNYYNHQVVQITGGTGLGQARIIIGYVGSTKVATVSRAWITNPDNTSLYQVKGLETTPTWQLAAGTLSAATATSATLAGAVATTDLYKGALLVITAGTGQRQARVITAYNGGTLVATVDRAWATTPDSTSVFVVFGTDLAALDAGLKVQGVVLADTVTTYTGNTPQTGDNFVRLGAPVGASIAADIASRAAAADYTTARAAKLDNLDVLLSTRLATAGYTAPPSAATIAAQVIATTLAELPQAQPAATPAVGDVLMAFWMEWRNQTTADATTKKIRNAAGVVVMKAALADDGTVFTKGQVAAGP